MRKFKLFSLLAALIAMTVACGDDDGNNSNSPKSIAEIASGNSDLTTLVSALERTGLTDVLDADGDYTVFAPTNAAFDALGVDLSTISDADLTDILLYHVLGASVASGDLSSGQTYASTASTSGPGSAALSILIEKGDGVTINGSSTVVNADIEASNGVIHVVDEVILPLDVVGHAAANSSFTELVGALTAADLVSALEEDGPFTVFAPVNSAFESISSVVAGLSTDELSNVLLYHVVGDANVRSTDLSDGDAPVALNQGTFTINLSTAVTITDANDNTINVVLTDVQATNGVIHVIDAVLLP